MAKIVPTLDTRVPVVDLLINGVDENGNNATTSVRVAQAFFPKVKNQNRNILCGLLYQYSILGAEYLKAKLNYDEAQNDLVTMQLELIRAQEMEKDAAEIKELKTVIKSLKSISEPNATVLSTTRDLIVDLLNKQMVVSNKVDGTVYYDKEEEFFDYGDRVLDHNTDVYTNGCDKAGKALGQVTQDNVNNLLIGGLDYFVTQDTTPIASFSAYIQQQLLVIDVESIGAIQDLLQYMDGNQYMALMLGTEAIQDSL